MMRILLLIVSAAAGAGLFILLREHAHGVQSASLFGAGPAPIAGMVLAFPAVYLLWEHHDG